MTKDAFAALHRASDPLVLFNIWDAGSAVAVAKAGAQAVATGSHSVAGAQGYGDGEQIPFETLLVTTRQIAGSVDLPLTVDMEAGYAAGLEELAENALAMRDHGAVGCNLEDRLIHGEGLRDISEQARRIEKASKQGLFVNARTDIFLSRLVAGEDANRPDLIDPAIERAKTYSEAGAGSYFIPAVTDLDMIGEICERSPIPVNVMKMPGAPGNGDLAKAGVARISYGPGPWRNAMAAITSAAEEAFAE